MPRALITGITGQDGSYLAEFLLAKGYEVHGLVRRISQPNFANLAAIRDQVTLHTGDMQDGSSLARVLIEAWPDEVYNLAAMSQVRDSYDCPETTQDINALGLLRILEALRSHGLSQHTKVYQAGSSEMFGQVAETPQRESTPFHPRSPYGDSKVAAYNIARQYRETYGMFVSCGILFNHESPRRGEAFLSRKVAKAAAEFRHGRTEKLKLGALSAKRDWGYAPEYVEWIWRILQHPTADDFVIATGETHSVEEFVAAAFAHVGLPDWNAFVDFDQDLTRPNATAPADPVELLCGDATKSAHRLGFAPKVKFADLVRIMVDAELAKLSAGVTTHSDARRDLVSYPEAKVITVKQDCLIGGHYHLRKDERFVLCEGAGHMVLDGVKTKMRIGEIYLVRGGQPHWFALKAGSVMIGLNSRTYDPADDHAVEMTETVRQTMAAFG